MNRCDQFTTGFKIDPAVPGSILCNRCGQTASAINAFVIIINMDIIQSNSLTVYSRIRAHYKTQPQLGIPGWQGKGSHVPTGIILDAPYLERSIIPVGSASHYTQFCPADTIRRIFHPGTVAKLCSAIL